MIEMSPPLLSPRRPSIPRVAATALLVAIAYYIGAHVGFILRLPASTLSLLWPPAAILTATLMLAPVRRWWIYLLAAFPAHLVAELGGSWPLSLVLALFATLCTEALTAAVFVRQVSDAPARFDRRQWFDGYIDDGCRVCVARSGPFGHAEFEVQVERRQSQALGEHGDRRIVRG